MAEDTEKIENEAEKTEAADEVAVYELGYHILSSVGEENVTSEVEKIKGEIQKNEGVFVAEEAPTMFRLAYTIMRSVGGKREKYDTSYFGWVKFEFPMGAVLALKEELNKNENILRFLIIKTVREDTRAGKRIMQTQVVERPSGSTPLSAPKTTRPEKESSGPVSEEELDRTIEELVVE